MASQKVPVDGSDLLTENLQQTEESQTASEFIQSQLQLEADAREALPYQFDTCTKDLGPLRQNLFSCLTCNPPPSDVSIAYTPAGVCYACSISCHGEHELVELFMRRNFVCDCGTTRFPSSSKCSLRINSETNMKGDVNDDTPASTNTYNQNFRNRFCGCREEYDAHTEKGTMFQCMGLGTVENGSCGEDWWHPECLLGLGRDWYKNDSSKMASMLKEPVYAGANQVENGQEPPIASEAPAAQSADEVIPGEEPPLPPGFPAEDDFEHLICYKCTAAYPWIKRYAGTPGFLPGVVHQEAKTQPLSTQSEAAKLEHNSSVAEPQPSSLAKKRKSSDGETEDLAAERVKKLKSEDEASARATATEAPAEVCSWSLLVPARAEQISLFVEADFRDRLCRKCPTCFPRLAEHQQLLEEEEVYEPPQSEDGSEVNDIAGSVHSAGSRSLLDRGEAALSNMDRVRAIEGVMAYNHLRDKVKDFLKPFAENGKVVGAEDIKKYFEKLRGDEENIRMAAMGGGSKDGDKA